MTDKGKHASDSSAFYRDLAIMLTGIILIGGLVFGLLVLLADNPPETGPGPNTTAPPTTLADTTSTSSTSSTTSSTTSTTLPIRAPSEVTVQVFNSVGISGVAGRLTTRLDEAGYQTLQARDFSPMQIPSRIWYRDGFAAEANELLIFVPGALVEALPDEELGVGADVLIIIGSGYEE